MRVCHATLSDVATDQRVCRAAEAAVRAGHEVSFAGYGAGVEKRVFTLPRKLIIAARQLPAHLVPGGWSPAIYWSNPECQELATAIRGARPEIIHAHDWEALPAASVVAAEFGAKLIYDSHEFAQDMRAERLLWRLTFPRFIRGAERRFIGHAHRVVTVGETLADELRDCYGLAERPLVLRNTPHYRAIPFRDTDIRRILLHYHGNIRSGLGLSRIVELLARLPDRFSARMMGNEVEPGFVAKLSERAAELGCRDRLVILPAVPFDSLFSVAAEADIGLFLNESRSRHHKVLAPNKLYEYLMSGLMVMAGPGGDFAHVIGDTEAGVYLESSDPAEVAPRLEALSAEDIDRYRRKALAAAQDYAWEREREKLVSLYRDL